MLYNISESADHEKITAHLHCASQPWRVTVPVSEAMVVLGKFWSDHGFLGAVLNKSSNSVEFSAPS